MAIHLTTTKKVLSDTRRRRKVSIPTMIQLNAAERPDATKAPLHEARHREESSI
jgi:hypothetical protein